VACNGLISRIIVSMDGVMMQSRCECMELHWQGDLLPNQLLEATRY